MWLKLPWNWIPDRLLKYWFMLCLFQHSIKQLFEMDQSKHWLLSFIGIEKSLSRNPFVISVVLPEKETVLLNCFINYLNEQDHNCWYFNRFLWLVVVPPRGAGVKVHTVLKVHSSSRFYSIAARKTKCWGLELKQHLEASGYWPDSCRTQAFLELVKPLGKKEVSQLSL